jgi:TetR/AcrR family transcriptional repressor of nem operon
MRGSSAGAGRSWRDPSPSGSAGRYRPGAKGKPAACYSYLLVDKVPRGTSDAGAPDRHDGSGPTGTRVRILDVAERLVQSRGFNGFSYADVASELGVTNASLHYHFPGKSELGEALIERYARRFLHALERIDAECSDANQKLARYVALYADVLKDQRMCLCGMLAADYATLPPGMRTGVITFFDQNQAWLERVLEQGREAGSLQYDSSAATQAQLIIGTLEGAMLVARPYGDPDRFALTASRLLATLANPLAP